MFFSQATIQRLPGIIPPEYMQQHGLVQCQVCHRVLLRRFAPACPRCQPNLAENGSSNVQRPFGDGVPTVEEIASDRRKVRISVPAADRGLWGQCLLASLRQVVSHNDDLAWAELLALAKMVLFDNGRGGKRGKKQAVQSINSNCRRWLEGQRRELWEQGLRARAGTNQGHNKRKRDEADAALEKALFDRVKALAARRVLL